MQISSSDVNHVLGTVVGHFNPWSSCTPLGEDACLYTCCKGKVREADSTTRATNKRNNATVDSGCLFVCDSGVGRPRIARLAYACGGVI